MKPPAIGYLRKDISGTRQAWDEEQIRSMAKRHGYRLLKIVTFSERTLGPLQRLVNVVIKVGAAAVLIPDLQHLGGEVPDFVLEAATVITVSPEITYARQPVAATNRGEYI